MKPLTICMFNNLYPPVVSGSSTQSAALSEELAKRGHKVIVITAQTANKDMKYEYTNSVHVYRLPALRLPPMPISLNFPWLNLTFTPGNLRRIRRIIQEHKPEILHLHNHMFDLGLSAVLMGKQNKIPLVITIHSMVKHSLLRYNLFLYPGDRMLLKSLIIRNATTIISPDINVQRYVIEAFGRRDSVIVPYGISLPDVNTNEMVESIKNKYFLDGKKVILSLGHLNHTRNRKDLIEAMPDIISQVPNVVLLVVGGIATQEPVNRVKSLGLENSVIFTDHVPHEQVSAFYELADLEVHWGNQDSMENTSLGIASLEAMLAGKVVVAAANEMAYGAGVLKNGENLILVTPGNPQQIAQIIIELLEDKERCVEIGRKAHQTIMEHFSWDSICAQTVGIYHNAIEKLANTV